MTRPDSADALDARFAAARQVADALLFEGYVLYPYRASARKNQLRWQFGVLVPGPYAAVDSSESCVVRTDLLVEAGPAARLQTRIRGLQVQARRIEESDGEGAFRPVAALDTGDQVWTSFDEAVEHQRDLVDLDLDRLTAGPVRVDIELPGQRTEQPIVAPDGSTAGRVIRDSQPVSLRVAVVSEALDGPYPLHRVTIRIENRTEWAGPASCRDDVMRRSFVAVHTLAAIDGGHFVSLLDPPQFASPAVAYCVNTGTFPVLIGEPGSDDVVLSSPIILYDHPAIAPESTGDMFDSTEIDEILALRVLTLTDDEKREARGTDPRSAAIVDRCDAMGPEAFEALHGTIRSIAAASDPGAESGPSELPWWEPAVDQGFDPWTDTVWIGDMAVGKGARVKLRPSRRADAQDLFVTGRNATVTGVFHDVDDDVFFAVIVDDDPGAELHEWHGRYLYFHTDEVELIEGPR